MENLRALRQRIRSVQNTQKITKAMQMVAGAKLRRMQGELTGFKPYAQRLEAITKKFLAVQPGLQHPLLTGGPSANSGQEAPPVGLLLITSDTGLCGTYNERVISAAAKFMLEFPSAKVKVVAIGRKGNRSFTRRGIARSREILDWGGRYDSKTTHEFVLWMQKSYLDGEVSAWYVAYTQFISALSWKPTLERILPLEYSAAGGSDEKLLIEPEAPELADIILKRYMEAGMTRILLEAFTAEHSARMIAMKNATENATEMISTLTLVRNKARQASITKELLEVVSGAEALK